MLVQYTPSLGMQQIALGPTVKRTLASTTQVVSKLHYVQLDHFELFLISLCSFKMCKLNVVVGMTVSLMPDVIQLNWQLFQVGTTLPCAGTPDNNGILIL